MRDRDGGDDRERADAGRERAVERDVERDVEDKYLLRLAEPRDGFAERRVRDMVDRLAPVVGDTPERIREAWHLWRAKEPQPETHALIDAMQLRLSDDKNLAFAALLERAGGRPTQPQPPAPAPPGGDDDVFARAARGAAFQRQPQGPVPVRPENRGERPNIRPEGGESPLLRAPLSAKERQHIQAEALEVVARGALVRAQGRPVESREDYFTRKYAELQAEPARLRPVERDLEKLRKVPGLGDPAVAEREFEKADQRYQAADNDADRAKAFTRAMALRLLVEASRRDTVSDQELPLGAGVRDQREGSREQRPADPARDPDTKPDGPRGKREAAVDVAAAAPSVRTVEVADGQVVPLRLEPSRDREREAAFRMKDRLRANSEEERLGEAVADEMYASQRVWDNSELMAEVRAAERRYESVPENADFFALARQHEALVDDARERGDNDVHLADRIALAGLAQKQLYAQRNLEYRVAEDAVVDLRAAPPWERDEVKREALALMEVEHRGERPFVDDFAFVKRELVRLNDDDPEAARVMALLHQYMRHSPAALAEDARWDPPASARVAAEGDRLLLDDAAATDDRLTRELTALRMTLLLDPAEAVRAEALARAQEVALLLEQLPARRSLEIDTN